MSNDIEKFEKLLNSQAVLQLQDGRYGKMVELREDREQNSAVWIDGIPDDTVVFNFDDNFKSPNGIFEGNKGACCRCDFILITDDRWKIIVCAELKKGKDKLEHIKNQLKGGTAFVGYCREILRQFWQYDFPLKDYEFHYVVFQNTARKRGTRNNSKDVIPNTSVDEPLILDGSFRFRFNQIIQKKK